MNNIFYHTKVIFFNEIKISLRNPVWVVFGLFQPVVYLLLFRPFLSALIGVPGFPTSNTVSFFVPGVLIMMAIFNTAFVGFPLIDKLRVGVIERWRVTPVNRLALVLGLVLRDALMLIVQSLLLFAIAFIMGLRTSVVGLLVTLVLLALVGITMASLSYSLALLVKEEGALASTTNFFLLPMFLLSGVMLPLSFAPHSIQYIAKIDPFSYAVTAARSLIATPKDNAAVLIAFVVFVVLAVISLTIAIRMMRRATA